MSVCVGSHRPPEAVGHHGNSCLDKERAPLPETETLQLSLKLRPSQKTHLTCLETKAVLLKEEASHRDLYLLITFQNTIYSFIYLKRPEISPATPTNQMLSDNN